MISPSRSLSTRCQYPFWIQIGAIISMFLTFHLMNQLSLLQNVPSQKLPVIYLLDSICKNVGEPYLQLFARNIVSVFLDAYTLAEFSTRRSFERLLQTWKNGMPDGRPVFSRSVIEPIERAVRYVQQQSSQQQQHQQHSNRMVYSCSNIGSSSCLCLYCL